MDLDKDAAHDHTDAQERLAAGCKTTVITDLRRCDLRHARIIDHLSRSTDDARYDQLTVAVPEWLLKEQGRAQLEQLAADARLALQLHHGEEIVVATHEHAEALAEALAAHPKIAESGAAVRALDIGGASHPREACRHSSCLAQVCMDYRHYGHAAGEEPIETRLWKGLGLVQSPDMLVMAGASKELADETGRRAIFDDIVDWHRRANGLRQLALTMHTDCGAMGGNARFKHDVHAQQAELKRLLLAAAEHVRQRHPQLSLRAGIVVMKKGRVRKIIPVTLA